MSLQKLTGELYQLFEQGNYDQCQQLLSPIKLELVKHNLLVPLPSNTNNNDEINDLRISQRIFEIGCLSALLTNNYQSFENYVCQLKPFYTNVKLHHQTEVNTDTTEVVSLYLLYLLSQGLISKFHIELELIYNNSIYDVEHDKYLQFPIDLEKHLMEGNYIKIWKLLKDDGNLPCKEFRHFIDTLIHALRFEIAKSIEKTYTSIPVSNCKHLLYFPQELSDAKFQDQLKLDFQIENWSFKDGEITFANVDRDTDENNENIVNNVLNYADQIESIV
jgi:26S proteasome regulatory subunit N12